MFLCLDELLCGRGRSRKTHPSYALLSSPRLSDASSWPPNATTIRLTRSCHSSHSDPPLLFTSCLENPSPSYFSTYSGGRAWTMRMTCRLAVQIGASTNHPSVSDQSQKNLLPLPRRLLPWARRLDAGHGVHHNARPHHKPERTYESEIDAGRLWAFVSLCLSECLGLRGCTCFYLRICPCDCLRLGMGSVVGSLSLCACLCASVRPCGCLIWGRDLSSLSLYVCLRRRGCQCFCLRICLCGCLCFSVCLFLSLFFPLSERECVFVRVCGSVYT